MNRSRRSPRPFARTIGFRRLWIEAVESRRLMAGLATDWPDDVSDVDDSQTHVATQDAKTFVVRCESTSSLSGAILLNDSESLVAILESSLDGFDDQGDELDQSASTDAVHEVAAGDESGDASDIAIDDGRAVVFINCGDPYELHNENWTLSTTVPGAYDDSIAFFEFAQGADHSLIIPSTGGSGNPQRYTALQPGDASVQNDQSSDQDGAPATTSQGSDRDTTPRVAEASAIAIPNNPSGLSESRNLAASPATNSGLASIGERPPAASVVSNSPAVGYFDPTATPRRMTWSVREESLDRSSNQMSRMTIWSGSAANGDISRGIADAGSTSQPSTDVQDSASVAVWRDAVRRQPVTVREVGTTRDDLAWDVNSLRPTVAEGMTSGRTKGERPVERVTLEAAVDSSLATLHWARRVVAGEATEPAIADLEQVAASDADPSWRRSWTGFAAATFSAVQLLWQRRRKRSEEEVAPASSSAPDDETLSPPRLPRRR